MKKAERIYLDNAATTFPKPESVYKALDYANRNLAFNAGRGHYSAAQKVSDVINETKVKLAELIHAQPSRISFESSATESLNIIILGLNLKDGDNIYYSPFEHNAIIRPLYNLAKSIHINLFEIPFDKENWMPDLKKLNDKFVRNPPKAVFLSHISNVTGYILPFEEIFKLSKSYDAINVLDCAQSLGVLNPTTKDVDFIVFAGHKSLYASFGVAGFFDLNDYKLKVVKSGGTGSDSLNHDMPENGSGRYESGSLNSVAIAGLDASLDWLKENPPLMHEKERTEFLISELSEIPSVKLFLPQNYKNRILGIVSLSVDGYIAQDVGSILADEFNICVRTGYHCTPFVHEFIGSIENQGTVRVSIGAFTNKDEIIKLKEGLKTL